MSVKGGPNTVTSGLVLELDAGNIKSYQSGSTTWYDKSGNGNNATLVNGPTFDTGSLGSIKFDGTNDYVATNTSGMAEGTMLCFFNPSALSWNATTANFYKNGVLRNTLSYTRGSVTTATYYIGASHANPRFLNGRIATAQIYNRALSASEVLQNYNATKGRFGL